eukprot:CAMPEP_0206142672 /NCGR_PEP_ID=MMETSP1473-20131121/17859_1 /ASSEMBLY_ACC=CAM_ASM_001109 /TAXON_ID=1461547 /ORGANISM="Stichococcus sp, Strain RCC1054" /LENGTH=208 /DNA_ID=CAMNT_0053537763 /DNA_START=85 /DNA_END=708 /DNA_ORIENTATION=-
MEAAGLALSVAMGVPRHLIKQFCHPSVYSKLFHNWLGGYTPCFIDMALLGVAQVVAVVLSAVRLGQLMGRRTAKYRLMGAAAWVHRAAAALAAVALLLVLFQLQGRYTGESLFDRTGRKAAGHHHVHEHGMDPFEWAGFGLAAASWAALTAVFLAECCGRFSPQHTWLRRFPLVLMLAAELAKFRFVLRVAESHGFYFTLYCAYFASD